MTDSSPHEPVPATGQPSAQTDPPSRGDLGLWWGRGARTAAFRDVDWTGLRVTPGILFWLLTMPLLVAIGAHRLYYDGEVAFFAPALLFGWLGTLVMAWASWLLVPVPRAPALAGPPTAVHLLAMLLAQSLMLMAAGALVGLVIARGLPIEPRALQEEAYRAAFSCLSLWTVAAQLRLVWRVGAASVLRRWIASTVMLVSFAAHLLVDRPAFWYVTQASVAQSAAESPFELTQELIELQPQLLRDTLGAIKPGPSGGIHMFAITFAPYAAEDVFRRESALVAGVMQQRFAAADRTIQLVNSAGTASTWPWATPLNLKRAIGRMAEVMRLDRDVLFIHLTSHGARNGELSADLGPLSVEMVTPDALRAMLDEAGIRHSVISVSACYSGSWIAPLANPDTLVMTAADADHTSYGCGRGSELTYFGRAMFAEALQTTLSFEQAHAAARTVIDQRERAAGKRDGFSNPQILVGERIRDRLEQFVAQRSLQQ